MRLLLFIIGLLSLPILAMTQSGGCEFVNITLPSYSENHLQFDNTAFFNFPPNNGHSYAWEVSTTDDPTVINQNTNESFILDLPSNGLSIADSVVVALVVTTVNGDICSVQDTFTWEVVFAIPSLDIEVFGWEAINQNGGVLPVELIDFTAILKEDEVNLLWKTTTEINNDGFSIERSLDSRSWKSIAYIDGAGNHSELSEYIYIDQDLSRGMIYYRLKQIDFDGRFEYSDVVSIQNTEDFITNHLKVFPNPSHGEIAINIDGNIPESIVLLNSLGQVIETLPTTQNQHMNIEEQGLYYLQARYKDQMKTTKLCIKH